MEFEFPEVPPAAYRIVRRRVLTKIRRRRRMRSAVRAVVALAACVALVVSGWVALQRPTVVPAPPRLARVPDAPSMTVPPPAVRHRRAIRRRDEPARPLVVRLQTDDPNVVILWMVN